MEPSFFERVYLLVRQIPKGKVATYGQIAALLGHPRAARTVGWALASLHGDQTRLVPWQRVINHAGRISISRIDVTPQLQRQLLEDEGVRFDESEHVNLRLFGWRGLDWVEIEALWSQAGQTGDRRNGDEDA